MKLMTLSINTGDKRAYEIYLDLHPEYEDELVYDPDLDNYKWIDQDEYVILLSTLYFCLEVTSL